MLDSDKLQEIDGWEKDHYGDYICEWKRELDESEGESEYEAFLLYIQEQDDESYTVEITVALENGVGDLLNAQKYYTETSTLDSAVEEGKDMVRRLEQEYNL